jgi:hypothetical protein
VPGLCYVGRIQNVEPIEGADRIRTSCGWSVVVAHGAFRSGDKCEVQVSIVAYRDTELPSGAGVLVHEVGDELNR